MAPSAKSARTAVLQEESATGINGIPKVGSLRDSRLIEGRKRHSIRNPKTYLNVIGYYISKIYTLRDYFLKEKMYVRIRKNIAFGKSQEEWIILSQKEERT